MQDNFVTVSHDAALNPHLLDLTLEQLIICRTKSLLPQEGKIVVTGNHQCRRYEFHSFQCFAYVHCPGVVAQTANGEHEDVRIERFPFLPLILADDSP